MPISTNQIFVRYDLSNAVAWLDRAVNFDEVFLVKRDPTGIGVEFQTGSFAAHAPSVTSGSEADITVDGQGWEAVTGMTGQWGYFGAVMHASEMVGQKMVEEIVRLSLDEPTYWVFTEVTDDEDPDSACGWALLHKAA